MKINMRVILCSLISLSLLLLAGCQNTVQGMGKDMQDNGKAIQKAVNS